MGVALIDTAAHPGAAKFYPWCPDEVTGIVGTVLALKRFERVIDVPHMTLMDLLNTIELTCARTGDNVLICCHGSSSTLSIPIAYGGAASFGINEIKSLVSPGGLPATGYTARLWSSLQEAIVRVWALKLNHVAVRACGIGRNVSLCAGLRILLGARTLSAPCRLDAYGRVTPVFSSSSISPGSRTMRAVDWQSFHPGFATYRTSDGRGVYVDAPLTWDGFAPSLWAEDQDTLTQWCVDYLPGEPVYAGGDLYIHAMHTGSQLVFPRQPDYVEKLAVSWLAWDVLLRSTYECAVGLKSYAVP